MPYAARGSGPQLEQEPCNSEKTLTDILRIEEVVLAAKRRGVGCRCPTYQGATHPGTSVAPNPGNTAMQKGLSPTLGFQGESLARILASVLATPPCRDERLQGSLQAL